MLIQLVRIANQWGFCNFAPLYSTYIAKHLTKRMRFKDRIMIFLHRKHKHVYESTAVGILWNRGFQRVRVFYHIARLF